MPANEASAAIRYTRKGEGVYTATHPDGRQITVRSTWRRSTGNGWEVPEVLNGVTPTFAATRDAAARSAFRRLDRAS